MSIRILDDMASSLLKLDEDQTLSLVEEAIRKGITPYQILSDGLSKGMAALGDKFESGACFLAELVMAANIMNLAFDKLKPLLEAKKKSPIGRFVIGTVEGDLHDLGKNIVKSILVGTGFEVYDLGVDVPTEKFVEAVETLHPDIVGMSGLLTPSISKMKNVVEAIKKRSLRGQVYIIIGGTSAVISAGAAEEVGADAYCNDAFTGVEMARQWCTSAKERR